MEFYSYYRFSGWKAHHNAGSGYFNRKTTHSVVFLAICNANYEFILVNIGDSERQSDGSGYVNCHLGFCIENKKLSIPACDEIVNDSGVKFLKGFLRRRSFWTKTTYDEAIHRAKITQLTIAQLIFNYRLSLARRFIENAFSIMTTRFRIFPRPMIVNVDKAVNITKACVALYNFF